ncbi:alcohol dehydrogenase catalytic domain-containing protein [Desulfovibrio sp. JC010]|uniref:MDR/zinc-dependent alcohol dehydrogenase-like family protein n=1 Tax=Desulfovibrio sp. JC010 TaxID=2593641 RepID=UPI0013D48EB9|nr:alcohol dehydrogenase catalytic domain-containing protein [Desulfovibrio sp. JC010]NDV26372.1 zinc-binding dehydrogenase [Desulfovibrio sp. JC010]
MRAIYFEDGKIDFVQRDKPQLGPGEALLKVLLAGICNTDIELYKGYYGFAGVPGHEFVAVVEECPDRQELVGKRVVADINCPVGAYVGDRRHVANRTVVGIVNHDGAFAEYLKVPAENLYVVADKVEDRAAVFAEPLAAGLEVSQQIHVTGDMRVMVLGDGKLGLLTALALKLYNPHVLLVGKHEDKLAIAAKQGVNTYCIGDPEELTALAAEWDKFDLVVEATGSEKGINYALDFVRPEGTIVAKTTSHLPSSINLAKLVVDEISIVGSRCGDIGLALNVLEQGMIDVSGLIEAEYDFDDFTEAFERAMTKGAKKVLVRM